MGIFFRAGPVLLRVTSAGASGALCLISLSLSLSLPLSLSFSLSLSLPVSNVECFVASAGASVLPVRVSWAEPPNGEATQAAGGPGAVKYMYTRDREIMIPALSRDLSLSVSGLQPSSSDVYCAKKG